MTDILVHETNVFNQCGAKQAASAIIGLNTNESVAAAWGSIGKIYEFPSISAFQAYQVCGHCMYEFMYMDGYIMKVNTLKLNVTDSHLLNNPTWVLFI